MFARRRKKNLVVEELVDEILVYDLEEHQAHCLNKIAALVWKNCDGKKSAAELAGLLEKEIGSPVAEEVVRSALRALNSARLLEHCPRSRLDRRSVNRKFVAAGLAALVTSITAPLPVYAVTAPCCQNAGDCPPGQSCQGCGSGACGGFAPQCCLSGSTGKCCR